jgi:peptide subunit release factor 1 (eRF1)
MADLIHGNGGKARAIFADASRGFWREFDLPPKLIRTSLVLNRRFYLHGMAPLMETAPAVCVCVLDRSKARLWEMKDGTLREFFGFFQPRQRGEIEESYGYMAAGRIGRNLAEVTKQHYKRVNDTLVKMYDRDGWDNLVIGCRDENWAELNELLHPYLKRNLAKRLRLEPSSVKEPALREEVEKVLRERQAIRRQELVLEAVGQAHRESRGALGLRRVLRSMEAGEIQTLLLGERFQASGSECSHCGHIGLSHEAACTLCDQPAKLVDDLTDSILRMALRMNIEIVFVEGNLILEKIGHLAAVLRYRAAKKQNIEMAS